MVTDKQLNAKPVFKLYNCIILGESTCHLNENVSLFQHHWYQKNKSIDFHADGKLAMIHYNNNCFLVLRCLKAFLVADTMVIARFGWTTKLITVAPCRVRGTNAISTCHPFSFSQNEGYLVKPYQIIWVKLQIHISNNSFSVTGEL